MRRVSAFKRQSRNGRGKIPALLAPAEVVPYATEVVFCGRCPRKLCKECYVNGVGADEDRSTWTSGQDKLSVYHVIPACPACQEGADEKIPSPPEEGELEEDQEAEEFEEGEIEEWGDSKPDRLKELLGFLLEFLTEYDLAKFFIGPAGYKGKQQYEEVITEPMCLTQMVTNLGQNVYGQPTNEQGLSLFIYHVRLIVANCLQLRGVGKCAISRCACLLEDRAAAFYTQQMEEPVTLTLGYLPDMFLVDFDDLRASVKQHEQHQQHQQQHQQQRQRQRRQEELARVATDRTSALSSGAAPAATATGGAPVQGSAAGVLLAAGVDAQQQQEKEVEGTEEEVRRCTTSLEHLRLQCRSVAGADGRGACSSPSNELARIGTDRTSGSPSGPVAAAAATGGAPVQGAATVFLAAGGGAQQQQQQQQVEGTEEELRRCTTGLKHLRLQCGSGGGADGRGACSSPAGDPTAKRTRMW